MTEHTEPHSLAAATPADFDALAQGIDQGIESHGLWTRMLMRCALLRESPGDDMFQPDAHLRCSFGLWLAQVRGLLDAVDAPMTQRIADAHQALHQAVRTLCTQMLAGKAALPAELQDYEEQQMALVQLLQTLRAGVAEAATQRDAATGLPLRHGIELAFDLRSKDARRAAQALWVAMIDVDRFKSIIDIHGAAVGDLALHHVAQTLTACLRENDILVRSGTEEMMGLFLVSGPEEGISVLAQRLLDALSAAPLRTHYGLVLPLTATVGWARVLPDEVLSGTEDRAAQAMNHAKSLGRNRFELARD